MNLGISWKEGTSGSFLGQSVLIFGNNLSSFKNTLEVASLSLREWDSRLKYYLILAGIEECSRY